MNKCNYCDEEPTIERSDLKIGKPEEQMWLMGFIVGGMLIGALVFLVMKSIHS